MLYAVTIFLSSFLLFLVQPIIARLILPWFGGSAAVWTTCLLFFQALLLAGYAYAHLLARYSRRGFEPLIHSVLLVAAAATLPIAPSELWKPSGSEDPVLWILLLLGAAVGLPYFLLAANSPLLQAWFARARPGENPYRLFAVSNFGSLVALLGYPLLLEPRLGGAGQVTLWSWLFAAFALLCAAVAWLTPPGKAPEEESTRAAPLARGDAALWIVLSATGSVLLLAVTNHLTQNVASVPLLWLAPLTLYLLSFILTFEGKGWYRAEWLWGLLLVWIGAMGWLIVDDDFQFDLPVQLGIFLPGLFLGCLFCHGELYRLRPAPGRLTAFYLVVAAGGALGGVLVAVAAPLAFSGYYELGIGLVVLAALGALCFGRLGAVPRYLSLAVLLGIAACAAYDSMRYQRDVRVASRSFYGVLRVKEYGVNGDESHLRRLVHGAIMHGEQFLHESKRAMLTTYYHQGSGIGGAIRSLGERPARVGIIGLGVGTIAAYGRPGDVYRFYEIDTRVMRVALHEFAYLADSKAKIELALGDARLALEREPPRHFDVLAVDAFSSDAIPVHLITREALGVYLRHVEPDGIVAFHVSNRFLDLVPVVARLAKEHGVHAVLVRDDPDEEEDYQRSRTDWVLVSRDPAALKRKEIVERGAVDPEVRSDWRTWTDDYSNLIQILK
ncbi:MAG TPA: fused MFS/spermidine synthase [Burkholderiales bacterium]|nr:fused MFS/spermidine synthase [Burkholderiales bacterium]